LDNKNGIKEKDLRILTVCGGFLFLSGFNTYMERTAKKIYGGAAILAIGAFIAKLLGALYRVPLTNVLGGEGLGLYQMIFPLYCLLLDFAGSGVPNALSKIISGYNGIDKDKNALGVFIGSVKVLAVSGIIGTALMLALSGVIAKFQGNPNAFIGYVFLAPSVFAVAIISCFRGYFQGKMNMTPTAVSQITEQAVKLAFGLFFAYIFMPNVPLAAGGAALGVTVSEFITLFALYVLYKKDKKKNGFNFVYDKSLFSKNAKQLFRITLPVTLLGIAIPLSQVADSFIIVNILNGYRQDATSLYGIFTGAVNSVVSLPVAVCYGIASVAIPAVSGAKDGTGKDGASLTLVLTFVASAVFAAALYIFSPLAVRILFSSLSPSERGLTVELLKISSVGVIFLSLLQTQNAVMIGLNKLYVPLISVSCGVAAKILLEIFLVSDPSFNVYGFAYAQIACYFTSVLINFIILSVIKVKDGTQKTRYRECSG